jgi:hypothetical protein
MGAVVEGASNDFQTPDSGQISPYAQWSDGLTGKKIIHEFRLSFCAASAQRNANRTSKPLFSPKMAEAHLQAERMKVLFYLEKNLAPDYQQLTTSRPTGKAIAPD